MLHDALGSHTTRGGGTRPGGGGQSLWRKMGAGRVARDLDRHGDGNQRADGRHLRLDLAPAELSPPFLRGDDRSQADFRRPPTILPHKSGSVRASGWSKYADLGVGGWSDRFIVLILLGKEARGPKSWTQWPSRRPSTTTNTRFGGAGNTLETFAHARASRFGWLMRPFCRSDLGIGPL